MGKEDYPFGEFGPKVKGTDYNAISLWLHKNKSKKGSARWTYEGYTEDQLRELANEYLDKIYHGDVPEEVTPEMSDILSDDFERELKEYKQRVKQPSMSSQMVHQTRQGYYPTSIMPRYYE
jgi:hypothetical protein